MTEKKKHKTVGKKRLTAEEEKEKHIWHQKLKKLEQTRFKELEELNDVNKVNNEDTGSGR